MNENKRVILEMLEQGKISQEEATQLLDALDAGKEAEEPQPVEEREEAGAEESKAVVNLDDGVAVHVEGQGDVHIDQGGREERQEPPAHVSHMPPMPARPAMPPMPPMPAMPAMPPMPAAPSSDGPEEMERYNEQMEEHQQACEELMGRYNEQVEERQEEWEAQLEEYNKQVDAYYSQLADRQEQAEERLEQAKERFRMEQAEHQRRMEEHSRIAEQHRRAVQAFQPVSQDSGIWPLSDEEYSRVYSEAYNRVYNDGFTEAMELGLGTPAGDSRLKEVGEEAEHAAQEAVERAKAEKQNSQPVDDWQERTRRWGVKLGDIGREIRRAMSGLGAQISEEVQEAMEEVQEAMEEVQEALGEASEAWQEWAEEEEDEDEEEENFPFDGGREDDEGDLDDCQLVPAEAGQTENGWYVHTSHCGMSALEKLSVNWLSGSVHIAPWDGGCVEVSERSRKPLDEKQKMRVYVSDARELTIHFILQQHNSGGVFGKGWNLGGISMPQKQLTVKIPRSLCGQIENLTIEGVSAEVSLAELSGENFSVSTVSGGISANALRAEHLALNTVSGGIQISGSSAEKLKLGSVSGTVEGDGLAAEKARLSSVSGRVRAHANAESFEISSTSGKAELVVDQCPETARLSSISGKVSITLPENDGFTVSYKAVSGGFSSDFPLTGSMGKKKGKAVYKNGETRIDMHTTSGKMEVLKAR